MDFIKSLAISSIIGIGAAIYFFQTRPNVGIYASLLIFLGITWIAYGFTSPHRFINFLGYLKNPPLAGMIAFFLSFSYLSFKSYPFGISFAASLAIALLAGVGGVLVFNYWNIGS